MRRGFKAQAERHAGDLRAAAHCSELETIDLPRLAFHLKVTVLAGQRVLGDVQPFLDLHAEQPGAFSGATFHMDDGRIVVIYNPVIYETGEVLDSRAARTHGRTRSDIAHEFAHLVLGHALREVKSIAGHPFLSCDPEQEEEANWLAGCLLLPRPLLLQAARNDEPEAALAARTNVTADMARWRMNATGARMQEARRRGQRT